MFRTYLFLFLCLTSCATEKIVTIVNDNKNYKSSNEHTSSLVRQVLNYYQNPSNSNVCIPRFKDEMDAKIESDLRKTKIVKVSEVLEYNQYYVDVAFFISSREIPIFLRIVLKEGMCDSYILENFKLHIN
jgi:hypothetical protein